MATPEKSDPRAYPFLKSEIQATFGKNIKTSRDCLLLSNDIFNKISFEIHSNTLRRFFGLIKSAHFQSLTTLDILSKYCGFSSFDEFLKLKNKKYVTDNKDLYPDSILNYLVSLFRETYIEESEDKTFRSVVKQTIIFLQRHPEITDRFQRAISKTKNGQDFYFEQFINLDGLNSFYGEGLRYYLIDKQTTEAQIFGHSLLCLKNWLTENNSELQLHYEKVIKLKFNKELHPFLSGRFFATQILYANIANQPTGKILTEAKQVHSAIKNMKLKDKYRFFPCFEYVICPVLLFTGHAEEALYYVNYRLNNYRHPTTAIEKGFYCSMDLYCALTFLKTGDKQSARRLHNLIIPSDFYFLSKKLDSIIYHILDQQLNKKTQADDYVADLIRETGFTKMRYTKGFF